MNALPSTTSLYRLNNNNGVTCILIRTDALLSITYRDKTREIKEADTYLPDQVKISGVCDEDESRMSMTWKNFTLTLFFAKTPGGERWYLVNSEVRYSTSNPLFEHIDKYGIDVTLVSDKSQLLFPTPVGKSFTCPKETIIPLTGDSSDRSGHTAKLYLREIQMQAFMFKKANVWGPEFECSATGTYRDETAPLFTGLTLAFAVAGVIAGYGIWRYLKIKKFQYGTMA
uniref:CSON012856 protein n=1 Tax=Culicoides sonorensis TaxID=179676 RepID=A0A336LR72_CULSO